MLKTMKNKFMSWFRRMPIGKKITCLYAGIFAVALILTSIFILTNLSYYYMDNSKKELANVIEEIEEFIVNGGEVTVENISALIGDKNIEARIIINSGVVPPASTNPKMDPDFKDYDEKPGTHSYDFMGERYLYSEKTIHYNNNSYMIQVFRLYEYESNTLTFFGCLFIGVNILGIILAYLIGVLISRKFLKPITNITETAGKISISDLNLRIDVPEADDEIRALAVTFNDMIKRLEDSFENQKQFISDASHELRTPISVIQGYANLISRWGKSDPSVLDESITSIKSETEYMSDMINQMLYLARGEKKEHEVKKTLFLLNDLVSDIVKDGEALDNDTQIIYNEKGTIYLYADENLIKQLIYIFLENAAKYGKPENRRTVIDIYEKDNKAVIEVADNGIGISEEDLPKIFERFYRGDKSRNKEIPGTGLGLSIAKWIAETHEGKIDVRSKIGEGTTFIISLPKAEPPSNKKKDKKDKD
ncbi:MAG: HAMP domain-containing histidine kinase [Clostridiales bacterium]|nr:HAMP domain-containing histidine kinase [Clostridiales bacterium]